MKELRDLGVGFYQFSRDQVERSGQMDELKILHAEVGWFIAQLIHRCLIQTKTLQSQAVEGKEKRRKRLEERLDRVRQKKAARTSFATTEVVELNVGKGPSILEPKIEDDADRFLHTILDGC